MKILHKDTSNSPWVGRCIKCRSIIQADKGELVEGPPSLRQDERRLWGICPVCADHRMVCFWPANTPEGGKIMSMLPEAT